MSKQGNFHINEKGEVNPCSTTPDKCPVRGPGGEKAEHFTDEGAAFHRREELLSQEFGSFGTLAKEDKDYYSDERSGERLDHYYDTLENSVDSLDPWLYDLSRLDGELSNLGREPSEAEIVAVAQENYKPDLEVLIQKHDLIIQEDPFGDPTIDLYERSSSSWEEDDETELVDDVNLESLKKSLVEEGITFKYDDGGKIIIHPQEMTNREAGILNEYLETIRDHSVLDSKLYSERKEAYYVGSAEDYLRESGWDEEMPEYEEMKKLLIDNQRMNGAINDFGYVEIADRLEMENHIPINDDLNLTVVEGNQKKINDEVMQRLPEFRSRFGDGVSYSVGEVDETGLSLVKIQKKGEFYFEKAVDVSDDSDLEMNPLLEGMDELIRTD